jgi:predicted DsbA family dithiol-disulfide isomerase
MKVEIFSDVVCPWCAIGKRRFEAALESFDHQEEVDVHWRAFELDPSAPASSDVDVATHLAEKYGMSREQAIAPKRNWLSWRPPTGSSSTSSGQSEQTPSTRIGSCTTPTRSAYRAP